MKQNQGTFKEINENIKALKALYLLRASKFLKLFNLSNLFPMQKLDSPSAGKGIVLKLSFKIGYRLLKAVFQDS
ncbi:hypothetical protein [Paenibacillus wulumuqiensis]|uniref:hypothetical protein n=1 Tax=Paenibacillus wulumuqiensis TaxID=1567107 RepID=UPI0006198CBE|nr:hypothetical protein [Paenibacillus wulumuqiensis]